MRAHWTTIWDLRWLKSQLGPIPQPGNDAVSRANTFLLKLLDEGDHSHGIRVNAMAAKFGLSNATDAEVWPNLNKVLRHALRDDNDAIIVLLHSIADALSAGIDLPERFRRYAARTLRGVAIEVEEKERETNPRGSGIWAS